MQIYDKISDCVYIYNKIYATQILIMLNSWLLTTILVICRSLTPALKNTNIIRTDMYYYTFINVRPFFLTKISESFIHERRKMLLYLIHVLVHQEEGTDYEDQIRTMLDLVQSKRLTLSGVVCDVNLSIMCSFAGRVISYAIMFIQNFYLTQ
ncbi:uncharacterized protein LOC121740601 [Aricia agestis]|uniref:uncharacterized protein LOC121740601 n=1 Tax=Aricia agestis TaxID=91739 RepID=UPI001C20C376|nr:uncharacterized protein LOC121740601 [Aricia agestis]